MKVDFDIADLHKELKTIYKYTTFTPYGLVIEFKHRKEYIYIFQEEMQFFKLDQGITTESVYLRGYTLEQAVETVNRKVRAFFQHLDELYAQLLEEGLLDLAGHQRATARLYEIKASVNEAHLVVWAL